MTVSTSIKQIELHDLLAQWSCIWAEENCPLVFFKQSEGANKMMEILTYAVMGLVAVFIFDYLILRNKVNETLKVVSELAI